MFKSLINYPFFALVNIRKFLYEKKLIRQIKSHIPVISVGNISFGGTGKTPFIIYLCKILLNERLNPLVLSRGYKRKTKGILALTKEFDHCNWDVIGDENYLIFNKLHIPIVISEKKYKAIDIIEKNFKCIDVIIVDDGFQHLKLHRNLDIVLLSRNTFDKFLREPLKNIKRAHFVLVEDGFDLALLPRGNFNVLKYKKIFRYFINTSFKEVEIDRLSERKVALISGIGNNKNFFETLSPLVPNIVKHFEFPDHHNYNLTEIERIINFSKKQDIDLIITTEKDFIKLIQFENLFYESKIELISSVIEIEVSNQETLIKRVLKTIRQE